jgi:hypothetical protein
MGLQVDDFIIIIFLQPLSLSTFLLSGTLSEVHLLFAFKGGAYFIVSLATHFPACKDHSSA